MSSRTDVRRRLQIALAAQHGVQTRGLNLVQLAELTLELGLNRSLSGESAGDARAGVGVGACISGHEPAAWVVSQARAIPDRNS